MSDDLKKHPKLSKLLDMMPFKKLEREVSYDKYKKTVIAVFGMAGRGEYPLNFFTNKSDDQAEEAVKGIIEHCLVTNAEELIQQKGLQSKCSSWYHNWVLYTGFREQYYHCKECGKKKHDE